MIERAAIVVLGLLCFVMTHAYWTSRKQHPQELVLCILMAMLGLFLLWVGFFAELRR